MFKILAGSLVIGVMVWAGFVLNEADAVDQGTAVVIKCPPPEDQRPFMSWIHKIGSDPTFSFELGKTSSELSVNLGYIEREGQKITCKYHVEYRPSSGGVVVQLAWANYSYTVKRKIQSCIQTTPNTLTCIVKD